MRFLRTNKKINLTIFASGSEVNLAIETSHKLAKDKIYSKVISVPCQDIFDLQSKAYKKKILNEAKFKISIEAASTDCWKKYIGTEGLAFGIDTFGKSAPYKEIYKYFGLTVQNISQRTKKLNEELNMTIKVGINGMGRIGRMVIRAIIESQNKKHKNQTHQ
jgi:transketolase